MLLLSRSALLACLVCCLPPRADAESFVYPVGNADQAPSNTLPNANGFLTSQEYELKTDDCHTGVDLADGTEGKVVRAIATGTVTRRLNDDPGWGNALLVRHDLPGGPVYSLYAHMQVGSLLKGLRCNGGSNSGVACSVAADCPDALCVGDQVAAGEQIGNVDCTGDSRGRQNCPSNNGRGSHLHLAIRKANSFGCGYMNACSAGECRRCSTRPPGGGARRRCNKDADCLRCSNSVDKTCATDAECAPGFCTVDLGSCTTIDSFANYLNPLQFLASQTPAVAYANDFEGPVGSEWSNTTTSTTPVGARHFLGRFGNDTVSLTLAGLPAHNRVSLSFDLFIIQSWDGNGIPNGPDIWGLSLTTTAGALLNTTFSNHAPSAPSGAGFQAFPGTFPGASNPGQTGAVEKDTLGFPRIGASSVGDSVYNVTFTFNHTASELGLDFSSASGLQALSDESWGLDNVEVRVATVPTGTIQGIVRLGDQSGFSVENATVSVYDATTFELISEDHVDASGLYRVVVPSGTYVLGAFKEISPATFLSGSVDTPIVLKMGSATFFRSSHRAQCLFQTILLDNAMPPAIIAKRDIFCNRAFDCLFFSHRLRFV